MIILSKDYLRSTRSLSSQELAQILETLQGLEATNFTSNQSHLVGATDDTHIVLYRHEPDLVLLQAGRPDVLLQWVAEHIIRWDETKSQFICFARPLQVADNNCGTAIFRQFSDRALIDRGLPREHLPNARRIAALEQLARLGLSERVQENLHALLNLRYTPYQSPAEQQAFDRQNYFVVSSLAEVQTLLSAPMEEWVAFLHPHQKDLAQGNFSGTVMVTGGAGTGKTVVAMHRARELARRGKKVLLTCFSGTLKNNIAQKMAVLCTSEERQRIAIHTLHELALSRCREHLGITTAVTDEEVQNELTVLVEGTGETEVTPELVWSDWRSIIRPQGLTNFEAYSASRTGRGRPLNRKQKRLVWTAAEQLMTTFDSHRKLDFPGLCQKLAEHLQGHPHNSPFDTIVADEIQDFGPCELRLLRALTNSGPDDLMLFGDAGQRIFHGGFDLSRLGFELGDRVHRLSLVYRTTEQIREFAEAILPTHLDDMGGGQFDHGASLSLLSGPPPQVYKAKNKAEQAHYVASQIQALESSSLRHKDFAVFARTKAGLDGIREALSRQSIPFAELDRRDDGQAEGVRLGTMHVAKGLEFKVVFIVDASKDQLPLEYGLSKYKDEADRELFIEGDRNLLYVSVTRARDQVFICYIKEPSKFLQGLLG